MGKSDQLCSLVHSGAGSRRPGPDGRSTKMFLCAGLIDTLSPGAAGTVQLLCLYIYIYINRLVCLQKCIYQGTTPLSVHTHTHSHLRGSSEQAQSLTVGRWDQDVQS